VRTHTITQIDYKINYQTLISNIANIHMLLNIRKEPKSSVKSTPESR